MGFTAFVSLCLVTVLVYSAEAGPGVFSRCPPPSKVYFSKPICRQDYDCKHGKVCCPNASNMLSCTEPASGASAAGYGNKYQSDGTGVYCGNVKCAPYEKCIRDKHTGWLMCVRA